MQANVSLDALNTLAIPAKAEFYAEAANQQQLLELLTQARAEQLPVHLLGGGSNLLLAPKIQGLVLRLTEQRLDVIREDAEHLWIQVSAGTDWPSLVEHCCDQGWWGLENLAAIPGTVGAAPVQNIGAYGVELSQLMHGLSARHRLSGQVREFSMSDCQFSYRQSVFKQAEHQDQWIIESLVLRLAKQGQARLDYGPLQGYKDQKLSPQEVAALITSIRGEKLPNPRQIPNAGSFFHNPSVSLSKAESLRQAYPNMPQFPASSPAQSSTVKLSAGWLIEAAGYKGKAASTGVAIYDKHALVLINPSRQPLRAVLNFALEVQERVLDLFGVHLQIEPRIMGQQ